MSMQPKSSMLISIVIPAYNDEAYVNRAIASCLKQTHKNIEVICVDDGSHDATPSIIRAASARDARVRAVCLSRNVGTHDARAKGLALATGQLVTFLDADDELTRDACMRIIEEYLLEPCDILQFGMRARADRSAAAGQQEVVSDWAAPYAGRLEGRAIIEKSFAGLEYAFNLAGKAYRTQLAQKAFEALGSQRLDFGEDALEYFAIAFFASTMRGMPGKRLYVYHLGNGLSAQECMSAEDFDRPMRGVASIQQMKRFLERQNAFEAYGDVYAAHCRNQLDALTRTWYERVAAADKPLCLRRVLKAWPAKAVVGSVCKQGTQAVSMLQDELGGELELTAEQLYDCAYADGVQATREEYERSGSYQLGRVLTTPMRRGIKPGFLASR